ncbi:type IV secretion system protein [Pseudomonas lutea]|uniref:type IV secretion system protein n=1 Tax=Pseudomonas lutea TaxID=243924 RepID=UPI00068A06D6|nr:type IV secretion system protein [Pseudomonas lutea]
MAGQFTIGSDIFASIDTGLSSVFSSGLPALASLVAPVVGAFVSLYAVIIALNWIWSGNTQELPIGDLLKRMFYMALFTAFAFNISLYNTAVVAPVQSIGAEIAQAFARTNTQVPNIIDQMGNQIIDTVTMIWTKTPKMTLLKWNLVPMMRALGTILIVAIGGSIFMAISFLYLLIAKIMVAFVLLVGPIFISFAFFPLTRDYFMKWASQLLNYIFLYAFFGIGFTLLTNLLQQYVSGNDFSKILVTDVTQIKLLFCYILFSGVMMAIPSLASQLTGGVGISGLGAAGPMMSMMTRGVSQLAKGLGKGAGGSGNRIAGAGSNRKLG